MKIKISIITPVYNKKKYLIEFWNCIQHQTFGDFECILIDDGSTDGSSEICDEMAAKDFRFKVYHILNEGVSHARNVGLNYVSGKYITFVDADDQIPENYLDVLYQSINNQQVDFSICTITKVWASGVKQQIKLPRKGVYSMSCLMKKFAIEQKETGIYGYCCGKIFSGELAKCICFDETIRLAEDFDFYLKLYPKIHRVCFTDETEYYYLQDADASSAIIDDYSIDYCAQLKINMRYKEFLKSQGAYSGINEKIVSQLLSNYTFYSIFYCNSDNMYSSFQELKKICEREHIEFHGRNLFEKGILWLFKKGNFRLIKVCLECYRLVRKLYRRR